MNIHPLFIVYMITWVVWTPICFYAFFNRMFALKIYSSWPVMLFFNVVYLIFSVTGFFLIRAVVL